MSIGGQTRNPTGKCLRIVTHARSASCGPSKRDTGSVCPPMLIEPREWSQDDIDAEMFVDEEDDEDGWAEMMCSMHSDGQCGQAGSEYCDFECPFRDEKS